jgi:hypothetical protein
METSRNELRALIDEIGDEQVLEAVFTILAKHKTAGFYANGAPISQEQLKKRVKEASERVKSGDYMAHEAVKKEVEKYESE